MNEHEIARRASALPDQFAARLPEATLAVLRLIDEGGECGGPPSNWSRRSSEPEPLSVQSNGRNCATC